MANPTKKTPEKEQAIIEALHKHPSKSRACRSARVRIDRSTLYVWMAEDAEFKARVDAAQAMGIDAVEDGLLESATDRDTTAAIFALKSWRPERYRETTEHKHAGAIRHDHRHAHLDLSMYSPEEQVQILDLAAKAEVMQGR